MRRRLCHVGAAKPQSSLPSFEPCSSMDRDLRSTKSTHPACMAFGIVRSRRHAHTTRMPGFLATVVVVVARSAPSQPSRWEAAPLTCATSPGWENGLRVAVPARILLLPCPLHRSLKQACPRAPSRAGVVVAVSCRAGWGALVASSVPTGARAGRASRSRRGGECVVPQYGVPPSGSC